MEISSNDYKRNLPNGIVMEVCDGGYWHGDRWIKTGDARWARVYGTIVVGDDELQQMVATGRNNVSPCPAELLTFSEAYSKWNLNVLGLAVLRQADDLRRAKRISRQLAMRNEQAARALMGTEGQA